MKNLLHIPSLVHKSVKVLVYTMWGPLVISWFITRSNYGYNYHKP